VPKSVKKAQREISLKKKEKSKQAENRNAEQSFLLKTSASLFDRQISFQLLYQRVGKP